MITTSTMWHGFGFRRVVSLAVCAAVAAAGVLGYVIGHGQPRHDFRVGMGIAYLTRNEGTAYLGASLKPDRAPSGFAYSLDPGVTWIDATGAIHSGAGHPSCLPYGKARRVEMKTVLYTVAGATQGSVVWVRC